MSVIVTQLVVDSQGAVAGVAAFEAAMQRAKGSFENLETKVKTFDQSQKQLGQVLASNNPVFAAQLKMQAEMERQNTVLTQSVKLGQISQTAANAELAKTVSRHEANIQAIKEHTGQLTSGERAMVAFRNATSGVQGQLIALSAGAGPVGVFLSALGSWGIAAAVGLGLIAAAFEEAKRTAHLLAEEAVSLEKFAELTGLSTATLQALTQAAAKHGVSAEEATNSIVKFTTAWAEARDGGGTFLTQLQKIAPGLADQIQRTKDSATAFELLTKAIKAADEAGNISQRNQLLRAAGGRGGVAALTGVSAAVNEAGSLGNLTQNAIDAGRAIEDHLLKEIKNLKTEVDDARKHADLLMGSVGAKPILETELAWQKLRISMAETVVELEKGEAKLGPWERFFALITRVQNGLDLTPLLKTPILSSGAEPSAVWGPSQAAPAAVPPKDIKAQLADLREQNALLGTAATVNEKLALRLLELKAAVAGNATEENKLAAARGASAARIDARMQLDSLRISQLGELTTVVDLNRQKEDALQKSIREGARFSPTELAAIRARNQLLSESSKIENQMVFDRQQLFKSQADQSVDALLRSNGIPPASERAAVIRDYMRMNDALRQANEISGTFASSFFTDLSHGVTAVDALKSALTRLSDTLIDMISRQLVRQALGGLAGSLFPIGGGVAATASEQSLGAQAVAILSGTAHTGAVIGEWPSQGRYVHPSYFDDAPRMHSGGGINWAAGERPFVGKVGEEVGWPNQFAQKYGGGQSHTININSTYQIEGAVDKEELAQAIKQSHAQAVQQAVTITRNAVPGRMDSFDKLGT